MEPRGSMEDLGDAGSNALVSTIGFYTKLLQASRQREAALLLTARTENRHFQEAREAWAKADHARITAEAELSALKKQVRAASKIQGTVNFIAPEYVGLVAERARFLTRITPVLEALDAYCNGVHDHSIVFELLTAEIGRERADLLAELHSRWLALQADGGVVPPSAPPHPDPPRAPKA